MEQKQPETILPHGLPLTTVHHALARAAAEPRRSKGEAPMGTHTFRIPDELKYKVTAHCERHGGTLDGFLRQCCKGLIEDYPR